MILDTSQKWFFVVVWLLFLSHFSLYARIQSAPGFFLLLLRLLLHICIYDSYEFIYFFYSTCINVNVLFIRTICWWCARMYATLFIFSSDSEEIPVLHRYSIHSDMFRRTVPFSVVILLFIHTNVRQTHRDKFHIIHFHPYVYLSITFDRHRFP